jgi:hypothetical protein
MNHRPSLRPLLTAGLLAAVLSGVVNAVLYWLANAFGIWSTQVVTPMGQPILLSSVALLSFAPPLVAAVLAWALMRWVPRGRSVFVLVSLAVLALFVLPPLQLGAPAAMVAFLELMHLVVAGLTLGLVLRAAGGASRGSAGAAR